MVVQYVRDTLLLCIAAREKNKYAGEAKQLGLNHAETVAREFQLTLNLIPTVWPRHVAVRNLEDSLNGDIHISCCSMAEASRTKNGFQSFTSQRSSIPTILKYNNAGTQLALVLSDHRIRIYEQSEESQKWKFVDQWRGHDAEIFEASLTAILSPATIASF